MIKISNTITMHAFSGIQAKSYLNEIGNMRITMFKDFPYLYEGNMAYETKYLDIYFKSKYGIILLVFSNDQIIGYSNSIPVSEEMNEIQQAFIKNDIDAAKYLYIGEVMVNEKYRGQGIARLFFDYHERRAMELGFTHLVFMTVDRSISHPRKPENYNSPEKIWAHFGFAIMPRLKSTFLGSKLIQGNQKKINSQYG